MQSAVLAMIDSVRPSVTVWYHAKTTPATIMRSSRQDSPMTLVIAHKRLKDVTTRCVFFFFIGELLQASSTLQVV